MTEKTAVMPRETVKTRIGDFAKKSAVWAVGGFALELASGGSGAAPGAAALAAGISGAPGLWVFAGGILGALLRGIPAGLTGLASLGIALCARILPNVRNSTGKSVISFFTAAAAVFFPRSASVREPSELLYAIIAAVTAGIFAACVSLLYDTVSLRGFDISEPKDCALAAVITGLAFLTLAGLDYPPLNIGRLLAGFLLLSVTARRGMTYGAVLGIPALFGLCAADGELGRGAAAVCIASIISCALTKYGKITRAVGFVFFGCAAVLSGGIDSGSWRIFAELSLAGLAFVIIPVEKIGAAESDFSDSTIAMMLRERLCFAADAIAGVSSGLNAAADTLERKYCTTIDRVGERAADKACRTCPNSMVCWGQKYELFHAEFNRLVKLARSGTELSEQSFSPLAAEECIGKGVVIRAINSAYSQYLAAAEDERRVKELRRIYTEQLASVHDILEDMGCAAGRGASGNRTAEKRVEKVLKECGLKEPSAFVTFDRRGRMLLEAYGSGELRTDREYLGELMITALGREMELPEVSGGSGRVRVTAAERSVMSAEIGAFQLSKGKNRICGDCYESFTDAAGALYIVLSDGMGSGSRARIDSALACAMMTRLLKSGISLSAALETVNTSLMVKSADESFATLDICRIDLNSGECTIYKAGAATTYIKCADKLVRATLSSPPAGTGGRLTVPAQRFRVGAGDVIIMTTDGASIDEEWLSHELSARISPQELSEKIARTARSAENGREDDISVIAVSVGK